MWGGGWGWAVADGTHGRPYKREAGGTPSRLSYPNRWGVGSGQPVPPVPPVKPPPIVPVTTVTPFLVIVMLLPLIVTP